MQKNLFLSCRGPPAHATRTPDTEFACLRRYGTWDASVPTGLASFVDALSGTPWMQINQAYTDSHGNRGTSTMRHGGTCYDTGTRGASLSDQDVLVRAHARAARAPEPSAVTWAVTVPPKLPAAAIQPTLRHSPERRDAGEARTRTCSACPDPWTPLGVR